VFDRFLGKNDPGASPEFLFKQRPFQWPLVGGDPLQSDLAKHNQGIDTSTGALLSFTPNSIAGFGDFALLAPTIILGQVVEASLPGVPYPAGTLNIFGTFGSDPRRRSRQQGNCGRSGLPSSVRWVAAWPNFVRYTSSSVGRCSGHSPKTRKQ